MARKRDQAASSSGKKMSLDQRIDRYLSGGRKELTPKQARRAAHKAHLSTDEVRARVGNA
jgi:hypothetical protein